MDENNNFEGTFYENSNIKPLPQQPPQQLPPPKDPKGYRDYFNKNPWAKGNNIVAVNKRWYKITKIFLILFALLFAIGVGGFGYLAYEDHFKTEFTCPNITIPDCPECPACPQAPSCPAQTCTNNCDFPSSLEIEIINNTD